jgi:hypothetical protein
MLKEIQFATAPGSEGTKLVKFFTYINKSIAFCQSNFHARQALISGARRSKVPGAEPS